MMFWLIISYQMAKSKYNSHCIVLFTIMNSHATPFQVHLLKGCADVAAPQKSPDGECAERRQERPKRRRVLTDTDSPSTSGP